MSRATKRTIGELGGAVVATLMQVGFIGLGCHFGGIGALCAIFIGLPVTLGCYINFCQWMARPFFSDGCHFTGHLYKHADGRIDTEIMPDGQSTGANALLLVRGESGWLVLATETNGIANVRRIKMIEGEAPQVKHTTLHPYHLY